MNNDKLYKYQIENLKELDEIADKLCGKTKEKYLIPIGSCQFTYFVNNGYNTDNGTLFLGINHEANFIFIDDFTDIEESFNLTQIFNNDIKIKFDKNVFLQINKKIDKIIKDNKERETFHNKLQQQLEAINMAL